MNQASSASNAISFWETCRIPYNLVLLVIVALGWGGDILSGGPRDWLIAFFVLLGFAAAANALYCAAYAGEFVFLRLASNQSLSHFRWILFGAGLAIAVALELWIIFGQGMG